MRQWSNAPGGKGTIAEADRLEILGLAEEELLAVEVADRGMGLHDQARHGAVHPPHPRAREIDGQASTDERQAPVDERRVLAEVPDAAVLVLGEPVAGVLHDLAVDLARVVNLEAGHAQDHPGGVGDGELVVLEAVLRLPLGDAGRARRKGEERVVDRERLAGGGIDEAGRIDRRGIGPVAALRGLIAGTEPCPGGKLARIGRGIECRSGEHRRADRHRSRSRLHRPLLLFAWIPMRADARLQHPDGGFRLHAKHL
jgi:hypothetical protein